LRCPFGCRRHHSRQRSNERSASYYATPAGKVKKERLNARRCRESPGRPAEHQHPTAPENVLPPRVELDGAAITEPATGVQLEGFVLDESSVEGSPVLPYVRMLVSLIVGIDYSHPELVAWLLKAVRQHRMARRSRANYVLAFLHAHPP
jgi:hypothetical protein